MPRVLVFGHRARRGGVPVHLAHLSRALPAEGFEPVFAMPSDVSWRDSIAAPVIPFEQRGKADLLAFARAARLIRESGADLVATHSRPVDLWAGLGARLAGVPAVATLHAEPARTTEGTARRTPRARAHGEVLSRLHKRVIVVARPFVALAEERLGVPRSILRVVENGVDLEIATSRLEARERLGIPGHERAIGCIARFVDGGSEEKGQPDIVRAMVRSRARITFVGEGPSLEAVRALATRLGVIERVRFAGEHPSPDVVRAFDALVLASRSEGCPYAILEALAASVPVIATSVGGVPDILDGVGTLVPPGDIEGLARALDADFPDPAPGLARARERYDLARFGRETAAVYREASAHSDRSTPRSS